MDLMQLLGDQIGPLVEKLTGSAGFDASQAQAFVPAALERIVETLKGGGFDLGSLLGGGSPTDLIQKLDPSALAAKAGVDASQASAGLEAIVPDVLGQLKEKAGGAESVLSMLGGGEAGDLLGKAGGLVGGLFKK